MTLTLEKLRHAKKLLNEANAVEPTYVLNEDGSLTTLADQKIVGCFNRPGKLSTLPDGSCEPNAP